MPVVGVGAGGDTREEREESWRQRESPPSGVFPLFAETPKGVVVAAASPTLPAFVPPLVGKENESRSSHTAETLTSNCPHYCCVVFVKQRGVCVCASLFGYCSIPASERPERFRAF